MTEPHHTRPSSPLLDALAVMEQAWRDHVEPDGSDPHAPDLNTANALHLAEEAVIVAYRKAIGAWNWNSQPTQEAGTDAV